MHFRAITLLLPFLLQLGINAHQFNQTEVDITAEHLQHDQTLLKLAKACPTGVHIIGVRATTEKPGMGVMGTIVDKVLARIPGSDAVAIDYPASGIDPDPKPGKFPVDLREYNRSMMIGVTNFTAEMKNFTRDCPNTKVVILGYSQGAHVLGTSLCGALGSSWFPYHPALEAKYTSKLVSILQFGDPTNAPNLAWHKGNASINLGLFQRIDFKACEHLGNRWRSYCDENDWFCDRKVDFKIHRKYVDNHGDEVVDYIVNQAQLTDISPTSNGYDSYEL